MGGVYRYRLFYIYKYLISIYKYLCIGSKGYKSIETAHIYIPGGEKMGSNIIDTKWAPMKRRLIRKLKKDVNHEKVLARFSIDTGMTMKKLREWYRTIVLSGILTEKIKPEDAEMITCRKCDATYSNVLETCPMCAEKKTKTAIEKRERQEVVDKAIADKKKAIELITIEKTTLARMEREGRKGKTKKIKTEIAKLMKEVKKLDKIIGGC